MNFKCLAVTAAALTMPLATYADDDDDNEIPYDVAQIFFELNDTDGDLGIHALIDGEPWKRLQIFDKNERRLLDVHVRNRLRRQGLTEFFFESAEPTFDELPPGKFFWRFPPGIYEIEGETLDGQELESETEITHAIPAAPNPTVNGAAAAMQCDDEEPGYDAPTVGGDVVIAWDPVTHTHRRLGRPKNAPVIDVYNYEVVVETEFELPNGDEFSSTFSVVLPPDVTEMTVPAEFLEQSDTFKYEVLVREASWNQTAIESCFLLEDGD